MAGGLDLTSVGRDVVAPALEASAGLRRHPGHQDTARPAVGDRMSWMSPRAAWNVQDVSGIAGMIITSEFVGE
jgi:hypothetical protein